MSKDAGTVSGDTAVGEVSTRESARFWRDPNRDGLEYLRAHFITHVFPKHTHETCYVIGAIERGVQSCVTRGTHNCFPADTVVLLNPGTMHTGGPFDGGGYMYRALYPDFARMREIGRQMGICRDADDMPFFRPPYAFQDAALAHRLLRLHAAMESDIPGSRLWQDSLLLETLTDILLAYGETRCRAASPPAQQEPSAVRRVRAYLDSHATENISLEELSGIAGLSPWHLLRVFRGAVGMPPHAYQTQLRIEIAKSLLTTGLPIAGAASAAGFVDQSHLTRQFKRRYGVTPGAFLRDSAAAGYRHGRRSDRNFVQDAAGRAAV